MCDRVFEEASVCMHPHSHRNLPRSVFFITVSRITSYLHGCFSLSSREFQPDRVTPYWYLVLCTPFQTSRQRMDITRSHHPLKYAPLHLHSRGISRLPCRPHPFFSPHYPSPRRQLIH